MTKTLRVGVMCTGDELPAAFAAALRELLSVEGVELALLIVDTSVPARSTRAERLKKIVTLRGILWALYQRKWPMRDLPCFRPTDMSDAFAGVPRLECRVVQKGKFSQYFRPEDVETIRGHGLDVILRFAFGIIRGDVLRAARYGVWSYHHDDELKFRGAPPAFWEIYHGEPTTAAILQRLTDRLDGGVVLQKCFVRTDPFSYGANLNAVVWATTYMPARVARDIQNGVADYVDAPPSRTEAPIYYNPTDPQMVRFVARTAAAWAKSQLKALLYSESWNVGVVREPISSFLRPDFRPQIRWLPYRNRYGFIADPFVIRTPAGTQLLMEEFDDRANRGWIVGAQLHDGALGSSIATAIDEGVHMSYPYLFEHEGRVYCVPEAADKRGVFLHVFDAERGRWSEGEQILGDFAAVDPTIVRHDGRWWMFCTQAGDGVESKLYLWHAPELRGPWVPHSANPVKVDVRSSRPGGTPFVFEGALYRPAQDSSRTYGGAVTINRVAVLTPTQFREEPVRHLPPWPGSDYPLGTHTLAGDGSLTVVDGKRLAFAPALVRRRLLHKLRRASTTVLDR